MFHQMKYSRLLVKADVDVIPMIAIRESPRIDDVVEGEPTSLGRSWSGSWFSNSDNCRTRKFNGETFKPLTA
jgi:hypothetical protein